MGPSEVVYTAIEDSRRHVCQVYFAVLNTYLYRFHQALKILQKEQRMAFSAAVDATLVSPEQGVKRTTVSI